MSLNSLDSGLKLFFSREVRGEAGEDLVEKQNADVGLMPVVVDEAGEYGYTAENRHMARAFLNGGSPDLTFDDGVEVISDFVRGLGPNANGRGTPGLWIVDGSGLSASNLVTPATLVRVLMHAVEQPWGAPLVEALAGPGEGTLAAWPRLSRIAAKTGTLRHTLGLAGIVDAESGTPIFFCYFVNHHPDRPAAARREIASALGRWSAAATAR